MGIAGFPKAFAAHVALETMRKWLEGNAEKVDYLKLTNPKIIIIVMQVKRIIFCTYEREDWAIYSSLLHSYFPIQDDEGNLRIVNRIRNNYTFMTVSGEQQQRN